ncbi:MAG TPA: glycosyltransferase family 39 protein [Thermoguttaceae bacterium]|nr:glycosyltransferase family 39 protein [Thermoguttaceae bacterium]
MATESRMPHVAGPVLIALAATVATVGTLAPEGWGPGVTCDEMYHIAVGKRLVMALRQQGAGFFAPGNIERNFPWSPDGAPVHPPLGNWVLGFTHHVFDVAPDDPRAVSILPARFAPALGFGLLVLLVGLWTTRAEGPLAGTAAAAAVVLVPRLFAHAHLAALDMLTALMFVAAVLAVADAEARGDRLWRYGLAGVIWGLAMLTRFHGLLVLPPVVVWLAWRLRHRAVLPILAWAGAGVATFFAGWPWLWLAPIAHMKQLFASATGRQAVHVFYLGRVWADREAPWHYPLVMFVVALPMGLLLLGLLGAWASRRTWNAKPGYLLVVGTLGFMLLVFAWPGTPVYDGVRLFLMVFPLWAISVGIGAKWVVEHPAWKGIAVGWRLTAVGLFIALQGAGLVLYHPCQLSHYSLLVGGLRGAEKLGFEVTYWGDAVPESVLAEAARRTRGEPVLFAPSLAYFQLEGVWRSSPALTEKARIDGRVPLAGWEQGWSQPPLGARYAVLYHRKAELEAPGAIPRRLWSMGVVAERKRQGVWLARLVELPTVPAQGGLPGAISAPGAR